LIVDIPLRFIGDEHNPANVVVEMSGTIQWKASGGYFEGMMWRRPAIQPETSIALPLLSIGETAAVKTIHSVFDNNGTDGAIVCTKASVFRGVESVIKKGAIGVSVGPAGIVDLTKVHSLSGLMLILNFFPFTVHYCQYDSIRIE
jgi:hypothetical protein